MRYSLVRGFNAMPLTEIATTSYRQIRKGYSSPYPLMLASVPIAISVFAFVFFADTVYGIFFITPIFASVVVAAIIMIFSARYARTVELANNRYREQARIGNYVLWEETYASSDILTFTLEVRSISEDSEAYHVALNLLSGEQKLGMAFGKRQDAESACSQLNLVLRSNQRRTIA